MNRAAKEGIQLPRLDMGDVMQNPEGPIWGCWTGDLLAIRANWNVLKEGYDNTGQSYPWAFLKRNKNNAFEGWQYNEGLVEQWLKTKVILP